MSGHGRLHLGLPALRAARRPFVGLLLLLLALGGLPGAEPRPVAAQELAPPRIILVERDCVAPYNINGAAPEMDVNVHGHNFPPGATIDVFSWEQDEREGRVTADLYGTFDVTITVFQPISAGSYNIYAEDTDSDGTIRAEVHLLSPCPGSVTLTPNCADPAEASEADHEVRVNGTGWFEDEFFLLRFLTLDGRALDEARAVVRDGTFQGSLRPGPLANGLYVVIVTRVQTPAAILLFSVPCQRPEVTIQPSCGPAGTPPAEYQLQVGGLGYQSLPGDDQPRTGPPALRSHIEIMFDAGGKEQEFRYQGEVSPEGGGWGPVTITPFMRGNGTYSVRVRQVLEGYVVNEVTVPFGVPCVDPTAAIQPRDCGPPAFEGGDPERRYGLTIVGQGFAPGPVEITFDALGVSEAGAELFPAQAGPDGTLNAPITPLARPVGVYEIHVVQAGRLDTILLQLTFRVPCEPRQPTLSLECDPEEPEPAEEAFVLLQSSGWFDQAPILLAIGGQPAETVQSDAAGTYGRRLAEAGLPPGPLEVLATQRDTLGTVVAEARALITLPCGTPEQPMLRVLPATVSPGFVVTVEGYSFPAGEGVNLTWDEGLRASLPTPVTADETGTFRLQVLIFHSDFLGPREVSATSPDDPANALTEPAELLVVPGRGSPPAFVPPEGLTFEPDTRIVIRR